MADAACYLEGAPYDLYATLPGWSWSAIKQLEHGSPRRVQWYLREGYRADTARQAYLRAVHCLVLEPDRFPAEYAVYDGARRGKAWTEYAEAHADRAILTVPEAERAMLAAAHIRSHAQVAEILAEGRPEVSITWTDSDTGLPCRGRVDWVGPRGVLDLKTIGTTDERRASAIIARNLWHGQLAHYDAGLREHDVCVPVYVVAAEGRDCHDVAVWELDEGVPDGALHVGRELRARLLREIAECVRLYGDPLAAPPGVYTWPGRQRAVEPLCLPGWALDTPDLDLELLDQEEL